MAQMKIKLQPFSIPNYVIMEVPPRSRQEGMVESPKFKLEELDAETLESLCDDFRKAVFAKAGKTDPRMAAANTGPPDPQRNH
jgi:hypothetical protein